MAKRYSYVPVSWVTQEMIDVFGTIDSIPKKFNNGICEFAFDGEQPECLSLYAINNKPLIDVIEGP